MENLQKTSNWKEFTLDLLIAIIPAMILVTLTKEFLGITGALVPLIFYFGGAKFVGYIRKKRGHIASNKSILLAFLAIPAFFLILMIIIAFM